MKSRKCARTALALLGFACLVACDRGHEPAAPRPSVATPAEQGQRLYASYCADCHGPLAHGDGPRAATLTRRPADLTTIAQRHGNEFRADEVAAYVDGRNSVDEHGPSEMPVWGREMDDRNQALDQELKLSPVWIAQIVAYLRTIQAPAD